jgi:hypothetical protein
MFVVAAYLGVRRFCRALWMNQRYQVTTWVWGKRLVALLSIGLQLKLALHVTSAVDGCRAPRSASADTSTSSA